MENIQLRNIYTGKKVLLTGHTGFKGGWLLAWLHSLGAIVKGYALAAEHEFGVYNCINGDDLCDSVIGDIRSKEQFAEVVSQFQPDFIFHLAAQPIVRLSYEIPVETFEVNVIGTANVLEAARYLRTPCSIVIITTDKVYENKEWLFPYREIDRLGGYDPYSASKACAELVVNSYRNSFFNTANITDHHKGIATARSGNVIGGGDWAKDRIVPDIVRALNLQQEINVRNPYSIRPWQHVLEPLHGYLLLGARMAINPSMYSAAYNFGPSVEALSVEELVKIAINNWGKGSYKSSNMPGPHEAGILTLDISNATQNILWKPKLTNIEAINYTIDWYKAFKSKRDNIKQFTFDQIEQYNKI